MPLLLSLTLHIIKSGWFKLKDPKSNPFSQLQSQLWPSRHHHSPDLLTLWASFSTPSPSQLHLFSTLQVERACEHLSQITSFLCSKPSMIFTTLMLQAQLLRLPFQA